MTAGDEYDELVGSLDYPIWIVTTVAVDDGELSGCLVGFATQCSIDPPRHLLCISDANHTHGVAARADHLAAHLVPRDQRWVAELFGEETGDCVDKFDRCPWTAGPGGVPLLDACPSRVVGRIVDRVPQLGDHTGHVVEPIEVHGTGAARATLTFQGVRDLDAGHPA